MKAIAGQNVVSCVLVMYLSISKNLQETILFYKYLRRSAVDEIDKLRLCWQHIIT